VSSEQETTVLVSVVVLAYRSVAALEQCLSSLAAHRSAHRFETIVVLNGATPEVREVADRHPETIVVPSMANRGFAGGCNLGASRARGRYLVFLNDDAVVTDGWLDGLVHAATTVPGVGAVSSVITDPGGTILEFGGCLDGLVASVFERGSPEYRADLLGPQLVSYASGCSLLVDRVLFESLDGFDDHFHPAYYEDADLSRRIWGADRLVVATPASTIRHLESESTNFPLKLAMSDISKAKFEMKWSHSPDIGRELPDPLPRIVLVDDTVLRTRPGCGTSRARMNIDAITSLGIFVQMVPVFDGSPISGLEPSIRSAGVMVANAPRDLEQSPPPLAVVVSCPRNFRIAQEVAGLWDGVPLVYSAEALSAARLRSQIRLHEDGRRSDAASAALADLVRTEEAIARRADLVVAISEEDSEWFHKNGDAPVRVLDPFPDRCVPGQAPFGARSDAVFITGGVSDTDSPEYDAVLWLAEEVMPRLGGMAPHLVVKVVGSAPPEDLLAMQSECLRFTGAGPDLDQLLDASRVAIAPIRYGAGVRLEVVDSLARGVPVLATTQGAEGIGEEWRAGMTVTDEPDAFAARLAALTLESNAWDALRAPLAARCSIHRSDRARSWAEILSLVSTWTPADQLVASG
jgi:O-antigen biosynthesis protein